MSSYKGHIIGGIFFFIPFCIILGYFTETQFDTVLGKILYFAMLLGIVLLFSLLPDIDIKSKGQKIFYMIFFVVDIIFLIQSFWKEAAFLGLFALLPIISRHRGWTHSLYATILLPSPFLFIPMWSLQGITWIGLPFYIAGFTGLLSHRIMDRMI